MRMKASEFKAKCLDVMDKAHNYYEEIIITKHGHDVAMLVPVISPPAKSIFGFLKGSVKIKDNIVRPQKEKWEADKNG